MLSLQGKRVLVVDDEPSTRLLLREAFGALGMQVTEAVDGADAIYQSLQTPFHVTTMDIMMPNVDGLDAIRAMRMVDPTCRIIVVSSMQDEPHRAAVRTLGVHQFVAKPIRLAQLHEALEATLAESTGQGDAASSSERGDRLAV
jgi:two-component system chemotaxis response regulator CheY